MKKHVCVRAGDRIIFYDGYEKEGVITEISPAGTRMKVEYGYERVYWFKTNAVREVLGAAPKKRWFS